MKKQAKKGFTIVELVIVIALIAILAAVLIPTFSNVINNAHESSDTMMVKNLNTILNTEEINGNGAKTMQDAIDQAEAGGYKVDKLTPTSSGDIVWDQESNRFLLINAKKQVVFKDDSVTGDIDLEKDAYKLWKITHDATKEDKGYSLYLADGAVVPADEVEVGIDVGVNANVAVNFKSEAAREVVIRTNGGTLNVDAANATVSHFGEAEKVVIAAVAGNSYHEYGTVVGNIEIAKGRVEVATKAEVGTIIVKSVAAGDVKVEVSTGATVKAVAPATDAAKADVKAATGVADNVKHEEIAANTDKFAGGLGTEASPYLIANADQFNNINDSEIVAGMKAGKNLHFKQIADISITYSIVEFAGVYDGGNKKITFDHTSSSFAVIFGKMVGHADFKNMHVRMGSGAVSLLSMADWGTSYGATFDNIAFSSSESTVSCNVTNFGFVLINAIYTGGNNETVPEYVFSNITNNVNLENTSTCTGFIVGSGPCFNVKTTMAYRNCVNNGNIVGGANVGFLYGNAAYIESVEESNSEIVVENCKNNGEFSSVSDGAVVALAPKLDAVNTKYQAQVGGSFISTNYLKGKTIAINQDGTSFSINTTDTSVVYKLAFSVGATYWKMDGKAWTEEDVRLVADKDKRDTIWNVSNGKKYFVDLPVNTEATGALTTAFKAYDKRTADANGITVEAFTDGMALVAKEGTTYIVLDTTEDTYINSNVTLYVYAYNSNGNVLGNAKVTTK